MKLSEMLIAIREYPALKIKYEAMREQQASQERTAVQLSIAYTLPLCVERACDVDLRSIEQDLPAVRRINAGNDLHQCGFSGAVFADQRMNAAAAKLELHAVQCLDARKGLCDLF